MIKQNPRDKMIRLFLAFKKKMQNENTFDGGNVHTENYRMNLWHNPLKYIQP